MAPSDLEAEASSPPLAEWSLDEIARVRAEGRQRVERKMAHVQFRDLDDWFEDAGHLSMATIEPPDIYLGVSAHGCLLGGRWTGIVVVGTAESVGHAWFNEIEGVLPDDSPIVVRQGAGDVSASTLRRLIRLCRSTSTGGFVSVPDLCYDGAPTTIRLRRPGETVEVTANAADSGREASLVLARLLWWVKAATRMEETRCHAPAKQK